MRTTMRTSFIPVLAFLSAGVLCPTAVLAEPVKIVSWNMGPRLLEGLESRANDIEAMNEALAPDVVVLIEVAGLNEARRIAELLGWPDYFGAVTNWSTMINQVNFALETAVISKIPIERVVEFDASVDGLHSAFSNSDPEDAAVPVDEKLLSSTGISGVNPLARSDRGTMRVDLENGLTIYPVHLKSNRNDWCFRAESAVGELQDLGFEPPEGLADLFDNGFAKATDEHKLNAIKRERVLAATKVSADKAKAEGRIVVIAGDYNTALEPGKAGSAFADCTLANFSCAKAPFPAAACTGGDGFDDTLAILTAPLVADAQWSLLSKDLPRTYDDSAFADRAIDHIAVPADQAARFSTAERADEAFGSDHFPIFVIFE